jgi:hypothetical protein
MYGKSREDLKIKFKGKNNPMYGKVGPWAGKKRWSKENPSPFTGRHHTEENKKKSSELRTIYTKEKVIEEIQKLNKKISKVPYLSDWRMERHSPDVVYKHFKSWGEALQASGLPNYRTHEFFNEKESLNQLKIYYDTREIYPYKYDNSERKKLDVGDYASDLCPHLRIERKDCGDFVTTVFSCRERFKRELERARRDKLYVIILVETNPEDILKRNYFAFRRDHPISVLHFAKQIGSEYKDVCQFVFGDNRERCKLLVPFFFAWGNAIANPDFDIQETISGLSDDYLKNYLWK